MVISLSTSDSLSNNFFLIRFFLLTFLLVLPVTPSSPPALIFARFCSLERTRLLLVGPLALAEASRALQLLGALPVPLRLDLPLVWGCLQRDREPSTAPWLWVRVLDEAWR